MAKGYLREKHMDLFTQSGERKCFISQKIPRGETFKGWEC